MTEQTSAGTEQAPAGQASAGFDLQGVPQDAMRRLAELKPGRPGSIFTSDLSVNEFLLVREAGGFVTDTEGGLRVLETGNVVAGNQTVQKALVATLAASQDPTPGAQPAAGL